MSADSLKRCVRPRSHGGGRAGRYEERHVAQGWATRYAEGWNDASAAAVVVALKDIVGNSKGQLGKRAVADLLADESRTSLQWLASVFASATGRLLSLLPLPLGLVPFVQMVIRSDNELLRASHIDRTTSIMG